MPLGEQIRTPGSEAPRGYRVAGRSGPGVAWEGKTIRYARQPDGSPVNGEPYVPAEAGQRGWPLHPEWQRGQYDIIEIDHNHLLGEHDPDSSSYGLSPLEPASTGEADGAVEQSRPVELSGNPGRLPPADPVAEAGYGAIAAANVRPVACGSTQWCGKTKVRRDWLADGSFDGAYPAPDGRRRHYCSAGHRAMAGDEPPRVVPPGPLPPEAEPVAEKVPVCKACNGERGWRNGNGWWIECPDCKKPITDRDTPYAVLCAKCVSEALAAVLARRDGELTPSTTGTGTAPAEEQR